MKKILFYICFSAAVIFPQENPFRAGTVELNLSADFGSISVVNYLAQGFFSMSNIGSSKSKYALIELRPGFYLYDNFSFEPDFGFHFLQHSAPAFYIVPNLSFSFPVDDGFAIYLRAGLGYSNSASLFGIAYKIDGILLTNKLSSAVFNAGTGVKIFFTDDIALRTELNYKFTQQELHEFGISWANLSNICLTLGLSLFLR